MVDFLLIGPISAVTYSCLFEFIKDRKMVLGYSSVSDFDNNNKSVVCRWFSNIRMDYPERLMLKEYKEGEYSKYDGTNIINIDDIRDIPKDYMGVPVTFLERWDPDEFELIGKISSGSGGLDKVDSVIDGEHKYVRLLIKRKIS